MMLFRCAYPARIASLTRAPFAKRKGLGGTCPFRSHERGANAVSGVCTGRMNPLRARSARRFPLLRQ